MIKISIAIIRRFLLSLVVLIWPFPWITGFGVRSDLAIKKLRIAMTMRGPK